MNKPKLQIVGAETKRPSSKKLSFSAETKAKIKRIVARYPLGKQQSAIIPVLKLAQDEFGGWLNVEAMQLVGNVLDLPYIRVYEVATFYTMFNLQPIGKHHVQVCTNCSCMIAGSKEIVDTVKAVTGIQKNGETSSDENFTLTEVECLGACVEAPMMQIGQHYYTKLTPAKTKKILNALKENKTARSEPLVEGATPSKPLTDGY